jgi:hypothetical protein
VDDNDVVARLKALGGKQFRHEVDSGARSLDNFGDQAAQAARKLRGMSRSASQTRISLGPFSTTARVGALALGSLALLTQKATGTILGLGEAAVTVAGGTAGAGAVGLSALAQGAIVGKLAFTGFSEALGGNKEAIEKLGPEARTLLDILTEAKVKLSETATAGLFPGLNAGAKGALRNLPVLNRIVGDTAKTLGGLARAGGDRVGSGPFGRDLATIGARNTRIIRNLGLGTIDLADATRHLLIGAGPLTEWLSEAARRGGRLTNVWLANKRATGELAAFFQRARVDLSLLSSAGGHSARGLINLFGAQDVDGTRMLASFDRLTARFERWSNSPTVRQGVGKAIIDEIPNLAGPLAVALANLMGNAAPMAAGIFWDSFWRASAEGKLVIGAAVLWKSGAFKTLGRTLSGGIGGKGLGSVAKGPVPVFVTNPGFGLGGGAGKGGPLEKVPKVLPWWKAGLGAAGAAVGLDQAGRAFDKHVLGGGAQRARDFTNSLSGPKIPFTSLPNPIALLRNHDSGSSKPPRGRGGVAIASTPVHIDIDRRTIAKALIDHQMTEAARRDG